MASHSRHNSNHATPAEERTLRETDRGFRALFEQAAVGMGETDAQGRAIAVNESFAQIVGYSRDELLSMDDPIGRLTHLDDLEAGRDKLQKLLRGETDSYQVEKRYVRKDGRTVWVKVTTSVIRDAAGHLSRMLAVVEDIDDRKRAEEALWESESRFRMMADGLPLIIWVYDEQDRQHFVNQTFCEFFGVGSDAALSDGWQRLLHPDDADAYISTFEDCLQARRLFHAETRAKAANGEWRWLETWGRPQYSENGVFFGYVGASADITERKRADEKLAQERELLQGIFDNIPVLLTTWDPNLQRFTLNRHAQQVLGWTTEEANEGDFMAKVYPDPGYRAEVARYMRSLGRDWREWVATTKEGERVPIDWANVQLTDETMIGIGVDLRERKQAERALRRSEEQRRTALEAAGMGTWDYDLSSGIVHWDQRTAELFGLEGRDAVPLDQILARMHKDDQPLVRQQIHDATRPDSDGRQVIEYRTVPPGRAQRWVRAVGQTIFEGRSEDRRAVRFVGVVFDTTEARRQREALRELNETLEQRVAERTELANQRAEQLQALATQLTQVEQRERRRLAQVLHEHFQQILVTAKMKTGLMDTGDEEARQRHQSELNRLLDDAVGTSRNLSHELYPPVLYDRGLAEGLRWLGRRFSDPGVLHVEVEADREAEPADQDLQAFFFQSVQELLLNAIKHGGADRAWVEMGDRDGSLTVSVRDNGGGCEPGKVFDQPKSGAFGLFSIQERLNMLGGSMTMRGAPGAGCTVTLRLSGEGSASSGKSEGPEQTEAEPERPTKRLREAPRTEAGTGSRPVRVMLVDDHKIVREGLAGILHAEPDIEPIAEASDGREAVEMVDRARPDVIVMDVSMPRMDGAEATRIILADHPEIRVIGLSMHNREDLDRAMKEAGAVAYLTKGGPASELVAAIRQYGQGQPAG